MPMQRERYPDNWEQISEYIRFERAGNKCEWCGIPNGVDIMRNPDNPAEYLYLNEHEEHCTPDGSPVRLSELPFIADKYTRVVLTVAHLGAPHDNGRPGDKHDKMDIRPENLAALCQRCHLIYDLPDHIANRKRTMAERKAAEIAAAGQLSLL